MKCVISVLGKDSTGIVAAVATTLAECSANIDDISQTILGEEEIFSMTMLITLKPELCDFNTVQERLAAVSEDLGMQITVQREDVFQLEASSSCIRCSLTTLPPTAGRRPQDGRSISVSCIMRACHRRAGNDSAKSRAHSRIALICGYN